MIGEIEFYEGPGRDYRKHYKPGHFFQAPVPYFLPNHAPYLRLDYYDPEKPHNSNYTIETADMRTFRPKNIQPIYELGLSSEEFVLCVVHKFRPVVAVSQRIPVWKDYRQKHKECCLAVPLYSTKDTAGNYKYSEEFLLRVQAYEFPTLFYLPADSRFGIDESIARFDRLVLLPESMLIPQPKTLTNDAIEYMTKWLHYFLGAELDEVLHVYRELALAEIRETND